MGPLVAECGLSVDFFPAGKHAWAHNRSFENVHRRRSIRRYHARGLLNLMSQDVFSGVKIIKRRWWYGDTPP